MFGLTQVPDRRLPLAAYGTITRYGRPFQVRSAKRHDGRAIEGSLVLQPRPDESGWFGLFRVRSPLLTESRLLSLPPGNEMFQFPGFAACIYGFNAR